MIVSDLWVGSESAKGILTLNRYCSSTSDSSLVTPWMRRVKPRLTKTPFHPVTAGLSQYCSLFIAPCDTYGLFGSLGGLLPAQSRGSVAILEELFSVGCPVSRLPRGRTLHRVWQSRSPRRRPLKATSGRKSRTSTSRAGKCQNGMLMIAWKHCTHSVTACFGKCVNLQHRIIRRRGLESDIRMPSYAGITTGVAELVCQSATLLLLL